MGIRYDFYLIYLNDDYFKKSRDFEDILQCGLFEQWFIKNNYGAEAHIKIAILKLIQLTFWKLVIMSDNDLFLSWYYSSFSAMYDFDLKSLKQLIYIIYGNL